MSRLLYRIRNSEFLTFSEVLRLKVAIVTIFLITFIILAIPLSSLNEFAIDVDVIIPMVLVILTLITILLMVVNFNRFAMHFSVLSVILLTFYYTYGTDHFYGYIMFFVTLTIIIFYQDIATYLLYGGGVTAYGVYYILEKGVAIIGTNTINADLSLYTYIVILVGFYLVFIIQFLVSDNIYERMNNEWVKMNRDLEKYQDYTFAHIHEIIEKNDITPIHKSIKFQETISELCVFINEFFEEDADNIAEVVEFYFFLHDQNVDEIVKNKELSITARKYASQLKKYLLNNRTEMVSLLFDFSTLLHKNEEYSDTRYEYNLNELFSDRIDKLLSLAILYKYLKTEITQMDKWGHVKEKLTHDEITELFKSKEFREFITYEQVNFYLDNESLFERNL